MNNIPPVEWKRNDFGLLEHINYEFNEDGTVNWRKLIKPQYLTPNRQKFEDKKKPVPTSIEGLDDSDLLILLAGIKEIAQIRGFTSADYCPLFITEKIVTVKCQIEWIANYETNNEAVLFSALADATVHNTKGFGQYYLSTVAENRSFVRAVRNFLRIHIVGVDEIGLKKEDEMGQIGNSGLKINLIPTLRDLMERKGISFKSIQNRLIRENYEGAEKFTDLESIPPYKIVQLVERLQKTKDKEDA